MFSDGHSTGEKFRPMLSEVPSLKHWPQKGEVSCSGGTGTWVYSPCLALKAQADKMGLPWRGWPCVLLHRDKQDCILGLRSRELALS